MLSFKSFNQTKGLPLRCKMLFGSHQFWIINFTVNGISSLDIERWDFSLNDLFRVYRFLRLLRLIFHFFIRHLRMLNSLWNRLRFLSRLMGTDTILVLNFPLLIQLGWNIFDGLSSSEILRLLFVLSETDANGSLVQRGNTLKSLIHIHSCCLVTK